VVLHVNCTSIYNKTLDFWNLVDTYNPDVVIGTKSWLKEDMANAEVFRADFTTFRRDRSVRGGGDPSMGKSSHSISPTSGCRSVGIVRLRTTSPGV
jgi:hypothetical protein